MLLNSVEIPSNLLPLVDPANLGQPFSFKKHKKLLFKKGYLFLYKKDLDRQSIWLAQLNLKNILKWYFYQYLISFIILVMNPLCKMADNYWRLDPNGKTVFEITDFKNLKLGQPYWFNLKK